MASLTAGGAFRRSPRFLSGRGCEPAGEAAATFEELARLLGPPDTAVTRPPLWVLNVEPCAGGQLTARLSVSYPDLSPRDDPAGLFTFVIGAHRDSPAAVARLTAAITASRLSVMPVPHPCVSYINAVNGRCERRCYPTAADAYGAASSERPFSSTRLSLGYCSEAHPPEPAAAGAARLPAGR